MRIEKEPSMKTGSHQFILFLKILPSTETIFLPIFKMDAFIVAGSRDNGRWNVVWKSVVLGNLLPLVENKTHSAVQSSSTLVIIPPCTFP